LNGILNNGGIIVKKLIALCLVAFLAMTCVPAFAADVVTTDQVKNVKVGARNATTGWVEIMDKTHAEAAKGKTSGEQVTGVVAGGAIGVRRAIHRIGAGAIDLATFWIPKKKPLIDPEKARLE